MIFVYTWMVSVFQDKQRADKEIEAYNKKRATESATSSGRERPKMDQTNRPYELQIYIKAFLNVKTNCSLNFFFSGSSGIVEDDGSSAEEEEEEKPQTKPSKAATKKATAAAKKVEVKSVCYLSVIQFS